VTGPGFASAPSPSFISEDIMHYLLRHAGALALTALASAAGAASAQAQARVADPADAATPVPSTRYAPYIAAKPAASAPLPPPQAWKALNAVVGSYDSMTLTMDGAVAAPAQPAPAAGGPAPATQSAPDPHAHHRPKAAK
jgi:hypothetical protein